MKQICLKYLTITNFHKLNGARRKITRMKYDVVGFTKKRKHEISNATSNFQNRQLLSTFL